MAIVYDIVVLRRLNCPHSMES